jgi:hypothetical protein
MRKFIVIYTVMSLMIGFAVFFVTQTLMHNQRVYDVYYELAQEAVDSQDFGEFISMQSISYKKIYRETTDDYIIDGYIVIGKDNEKYINQLGVFVIPINEVSYAENIDDVNDQTGLRIIDQDTSNTFYEIYTDPLYENTAVSYGFSLMDFYFYSVAIEDDINATIELYDYQGDLIVTTYQSILFQDYPELENGFIDGMDSDTLNDLIDDHTYVTPIIIRNTTIFAVFDIALGIGLYLLIKNRKEKRIMSYEK